MFCCYIHCKYNLPILNYEPLYEVEITKLNIDKNGIYSYFMSHKTEIQHFVLIVNDVILMLIYGVQKNIIEIKYNKNKFIKKYCKLFGIKNVCFNKLDMSNFILNYTFKEHTH